MVACNLTARQAAILSIINMGMLCTKVTAAKGKHNAKQDIQQFVRIRDTLNNHFNMLEQYLKERRGHVRSNIDERSNTGRCGSLRKLRQRVQG
jgi:hypothetical protein